MSDRNASAAIGESQRSPTPRSGITFRSPSDFRSINAFADKLQALAGLPPPEQLRDILALCQKYRIPSIWKRATYSQLEHEAVHLLTTMAFSKQKDWPGILRGALKRLGLEVDRRGRPWKHPREVTDIFRGRKLEGLVRRFKTAFRVKQKIGSSEGRDTIAAELRKRKLTNREIVLVSSMHSPLDAACCFYHEVHEPMVSVKAIKNSYARYRRRLTT